METIGAEDFFEGGHSDFSVDMLLAENVVDGEIGGGGGARRSEIWKEERSYNQD